jgi:hypothetical protein
VKAIKRKKREKQENKKTQKTGACSTASTKEHSTVRRGARRRKRENVTYSKKEQKLFQKGVRKEAA